VSSLLGLQGRVPVFQAPKGSGVQASVTMVALHLAGVPLERLSVYDGSWTEYAQRAPERIRRST